MRLRICKFCSFGKLTASTLIISFYFTIKFLYVTHDVGVIQVSESAKDVDLFFVNASTPICPSTYLDTPPSYVAEAGCAGNTCQLLTCRNIVSGHNRKIYGLARQFMVDHPRSLPSDQDLVEKTADCAKFRALRGYPDHIDPEYLDMPIAFTILVHKDAAQVERLLRSIYRPQNIYCIHVDSRAAASIHAAMASLSQCFQNVFLASKMERIVYAGFSRLQADINCMRDLDKHSSNWKYLLNLAAQSFPLQTPEDMARILRIYNGTNDIEGISGRRILRYRFDVQYLEDVNKGTLKKTVVRNPAPPDGISIVRGSAYGVFSRAFVQFVLTNKVALDLLEWSRKTYSPDEHYWATLHHLYSNQHLKTPGGYAGAPDDKPWLALFVKWGLASKCTGRLVRAVCILGVEDLPDLVSRHEFFVNKFYADYQPLALDCLEAWIQHKTVCPTNFDYDFYRRLPFIPSHKN